MSKFRILEQKIANALKLTTLLLLTLLSFEVFADSSALANRLYNKGVQAYKADRLTQPSHSNAFDYFTAVLTLDKKHQGAQKGLENIVDRYIRLIDRAARRGDYKAASRTFNLAINYFPGNKKLKQAAIRLARMQQTSLKEFLADIANPDKRTFKLPAYELQRKSPLVKTILAALADRIKTSEELVMIRARSDREGRWIYKTLKENATGYRVRGDIQVSKKPSIELSDPLNE